MTASDPQIHLLRRLVHDLRGPARALEDIPQWIREDVAEIGICLPPSSERLLPMLEQNAAELDHILVRLSDWLAACEVPSDPPYCADPASLIADLYSAADVEIDTALGPLPVARIDVAKIFTEAVENAIRFHPGGRPQLVFSGAVGGAYWDLSITDDGPGPPTATPGRLVPPLARSAVGSRKAGPGFGLAIIHQICGRYDAAFEFGQGPCGRGARLQIRGRMPDEMRGMGQ